MPKIDLCFSGWLRGVNIEQAVVISDDVVAAVDVSQMDAEELTKKLENRELFISLASALDQDCEDSEIQIFDFEPSK